MKKILKSLYVSCFSKFFKYKIYYYGVHNAYCVIYKNKFFISKEIPDIISESLLNEKYTLSTIDPQKYMIDKSHYSAEYPSLKSSIERNCFVKTEKDALDICKFHREYLKWYNNKKTIRFVNYG